MFVGKVFEGKWEYDKFMDMADRDNPECDALVIKSSESLSPYKGSSSKKGKDIYKIHLHNELEAALKGFNFNVLEEYYEDLT